MSQTLVLEVPDATWVELIRSAQVRHQSPEAVVLRLVENSLSDPLLKLIGSIQSDVSDGAERHDEYIGEVLYRSLRDCE